MRPLVPMRGALADPALLGSFLSGSSWDAWRIVLTGLMGERLSSAERRTWHQLTGRAREPGRRVDEGWLVCGRRAGKSRSLATTAAYLGALCDHSDALAAGERGVVLCVAADQRQAGIILDYCEACLRSSPITSQALRGRTQDAIELASNISIEVRAASFRRLRGPTYVAVLADELAFWSVDEASANPDREILDAIRPGLATTKGPLLCASSPYSRKGELYRAYRQHHGPEGDAGIVVVKAPSRTLNPSLPENVVQRAMARDAASAKAEFLAEFRSDVESFLTREMIEAAVSHGVRERPPLQGVAYVGFCDPSGGSGTDSMSLAIAHREGDRAVLDALRERKPPFRPSAAVSEFAALLRSYRVSRLYGDRYGAQWVAERFKASGIGYWPAEKPKSDIYLSLLPPLNSGLVDLIDNDRLVSQLSDLERRVRSGGHDVVDHAPRGHDDLANAAAGAIWRALGRKAVPDTFVAPQFFVAPVASGIGSSSVRWLDH